MSDLLLDLRYALRTLARSPAFTATAVLTLALGIGATTAIFSVTHEALLEAPPVDAPDRLAVVYTTSRRGNPRSASSYPDYLDYGGRSRAFRDMATYSWVPLSLQDQGAAEFATGQLVTGNYFEVLGVRAAIGRTLLPADDRRGAAEQVVVVSHDFWLRRLGAVPSALGTTLRLNGLPFTVVGVAHPEFRGITIGRGPDVWLPMFAGPLLGDGVGAVGDPAVFDGRSDRWLSGILGRLAPGATVAQARNEMLGISRQLAAEDPDRGGRSITVDPLPRRILPLGSEADLSRFLLLLLGVVACTLLLTSANLASLLLSRASARQREVGIRLAVGAARPRLVRQLLTESAMLGGLGAAAGLFVGVSTLDLLGGFELPGGVALRDLAVRLDARMLAAALGCAAVSVLLFGLVPAFQATRNPVLLALRGGAGAGVAGRLRRWLVAVQVALSLVLLVGSGLFLRTLARALAFEPGFQPEGVIEARFSLALLRYSPEARTAFAGSLRDVVRGLPGVQATTIATLVPFQPGGHRGMGVRVDGYEPPPGEDMRVDLVLVGPQYFEVLGIPIRHGRAILGSEAAPGRPEVVISRAMADRWWPGRDPLGGTVRLGDEAFEVVGVAGDVVWEDLGEQASPYVFLPLVEAAPPTPAPWGLTLGVRTTPGSLTLAVRTTGDPAAVVPALRGAFQALDPELSLMSIGPLSDQMNRQLMPQRMGAALLTLFGVLALLIAGLGIYGVVAFHVARETRPIGVRIALGAPRRHVIGLVARGIGLPVGVGLMAGMAAAWALTRTVERFLFRVSPHDPLTFVTVGLGLAAVAALAMLAPARRAARIHPMEALRHE